MKTCDPLLVVILGPTASGKTALALAIARRFGGEIISCDSVAMYREFDIGTAKPSTAERAEIPHHLVDCVDPETTVTAGDYSREARQILSEIASREGAGKGGLSRCLPIVTGGTGLYLRALLDGLFSGPQRSDELRQKLRQRVEKFGPQYLHRMLRRLDTKSAERIHAHDIPKIIRAIEVCLASRSTIQGSGIRSPTTSNSSRRTITEYWEQGRKPLPGFRILRLGLNPGREALYKRINERAVKMFEAGLVRETEQLLAKYGSRAAPLTSLGYKQAVQFLRGHLTFEGALNGTQQAHRNYAKRQNTWFRREPDVLWLAGFGHEPDIQEKALAAVEAQI